MRIGENIANTAKKSCLNSAYLQSNIRNQNRIKNIITKRLYWVWSKKIFGFLSFSKMAGHHLIDLHDWQHPFLQYLWFHLATSSLKLMILILFRSDLFNSRQGRFLKGQIAQSNGPFCIIKLFNLDWFSKWCSELDLWLANTISASIWLEESAISLL